MVNINAKKANGSDDESQRPACHEDNNVPDQEQKPVDHIDGIPSDKVHDRAIHKP